MRHLLALAPVILLATVPALGSPQQTVEVHQSITDDAIVSPDVIATAFTHRTTNDAWFLDILVLWRGKPGWFMTGDAHGGNGGGDMNGHTSLSFTRGGREFTVTIDDAAAKATVQGTEISLRDANVVLVDHVDTKTTPDVVGTLKIESHFSGPPRDLRPALRSSPKIIEFLRCDDRIPDLPAPIIAMIDATCTAIRGGK